MKSWKLVFLLTLAVSVMASTVFGAAGAIIVDEDFEDDEIFTELNWPIFDIITLAQQRPPQPAELIAWQGYEVRADVLASTKPMDAPAINPVPSAVTLSTDRFFTGAQSLCLNSNSTTPSSTILSPGNQPGQSPDIWGVFQVAVSVNLSTTANPWPAPGTVIGRIRWDTRVRTEVAEKPHRENATYVDKFFDINLVVNSSTSIDVISVHPTDPLIETKIGSFEGGPGDWAMISLLQQGNVPDPQVDETATSGTPQLREWVCYDLREHTTGRMVYIGPQPSLPYHASEQEFIDLGLDLYPRLMSGVHIFCNSDAPGVTYLPLEIHNSLDDAVWGAWGTATNTTDGVAHGTLLDGYEIRATSGEMDLYIDDLYYGVGGSDDPEDGANGITLATAARLQPFTGIIDPTWGITTETPALSVREWAIYE